MGFGPSRSWIGRYCRYPRMAFRSERWTIKGTLARVDLPWCEIHHHWHDPALVLMNLLMASWEAAVRVQSLGGFCRNRVESLSFFESSLFLVCMGCLLLLSLQRMLKILLMEPAKIPPILRVHGFWFLRLIFHPKVAPYLPVLQSMIIAVVYFRPFGALTPNSGAPIANINCWLWPGLLM